MTAVPQRARRLVAALLLLTAVAAPALAQGRWYNPYQKGVDAFKARRWQEAIDNLNKAIAIDGKAESQKRVEGVFFEDYYPYYYLGVAYLRIGDLDHAGANLAKAAAGPKMSGDLAAGLRRAQDELTAAQTAQRPPPAKPADMPARSNAPPAAPAVAKPAEAAKPEPAKPEAKTPALDPRFEPLVADAERALANQNFVVAIRQFNELRQIDVAEFDKRGLGAKRDEAGRGRAGVLVQQGNAALRDGHLTDALAMFQEAQRLWPPSIGATNGIRGVEDRRRQYADAKTAGLAAVATQPAAALARLQQARDADADQFAKDGLAASLDTAQKAVSASAAAQAEARKAADARAAADRLVREGADLARQHDYAGADAKYRAALDADKDNTLAHDKLFDSEGYTKLKDACARFTAQQLDSALSCLANVRELDADRFVFDGLDKTADELSRRKAAATAPRTPAEPVAAPAASPEPVPSTHLLAVRSGVAAFIDGNLDQSIALLAPAAAADGDLAPGARAHLHAFLAAAYAEKSIAARKADDRDAFKRQALDQYKLALGVEPGYQLPQQFVSPAVRTILDPGRK